MTVDAKCQQDRLVNRIDFAFHDFPSYCKESPERQGHGDKQREKSWFQPSTSHGPKTTPRGDDPPDGDMLRSHMQKLRRAIDGSLEHRLIETIPKQGYRVAGVHGEP